MVSLRGLSYEQAAAITGVAVGTAKCRVFRARRALQEMLTEQACEAKSAAPPIGWSRRISHLPPRDPRPMESPRPA